MRIRFESENGLPLDKVLNIVVCVIIIRSVFEDDGKFYPQICLEHCSLEYEERRNVDDSYVYSIIPLKSINNSEYGKYLFKKRIQFIINGS